MNNVILSGRITKDPEVKTTNNTNAAYCQFSIAVRNEFRNAQGEYDSQFIDCAAFNSTATYMSRYIKKGNMLLIKGRIQVQNYQDKDGSTKHFVSVVCESVENITPNNVAVEQQPTPQPQPKKEEPKQTSAPNSFGLDDADTALPWL